MRFFYRLAFILILVAIPIFTMAVADSGGAPGGPLPVPTPIPDGVRVTAEMTVWRCQKYGRIVDHWLNMDMKPSDSFRHVSEDHRQLIMAIMAKESSCLEDATDGLSYGLMQVIPRPWLPNAYSNNTNVLAGMYILDGCLELSGGDVELALAFYNCGQPKVEENACGSRGGIHYAADVLSFWLPLFSDTLTDPLGVRLELMEEEL